MRTPEQIRNLRTVLAMAYSPIFLFVSDALINQFADQLEQEIKSKNQKKSLERRNKMEFLGHVWTVRDLIIVLGLPSLFVVLHWLMGIIWDWEYKRNKKK